MASTSQKRVYLCLEDKKAAKTFVYLDDI
jgi:hypothetical protein